MQDFVNVYRNYANFRGRSRRREYWMFQLFFAAIVLTLAVLSGLLNGGDMSGEPTTLGAKVLMGLLGAFALASIVPSWAVTVRRLHDTGRSGWWVLIGLLPFVGSIVVLVFTVMDSEPSSNKWGANPKAGEMYGATRA